ncbi:hypothetical protein I862_02830 [endosymbiont of Acanthamoeba sp. UWC8]|uniref:hypothetical protein n=1 Tax=endosymbiont of Acanthamoeba sp. UWC8 TaxID=86106 RepID=UPI0004D19FE0|nr:hypothetical protein [endosymbiont of Acanthamoeba sp. UWC8]AIF81129.1 hypothetical protein I862_02830 [endosymbiont of Acanthamoeba sp. UWC8]
MKKYHISPAKLFWHLIEGITSSCFLKFKHRLIISDYDVSRNIAKDTGMVAKDINRILEKVKGSHERQQKR